MIQVLTTYPGCLAKQHLPAKCAAKTNFRVFEKHALLVNLFTGYLSSYNFPNSFPLPHVFLHCPNCPIN
jgi:hypothetical protein